MRTCHYRGPYPTQRLCKIGVDLLACACLSGIFRVFWCGWGCSHLSLLRFLCTSNRQNPTRAGLLHAGTPASIRPPTVEGAKQPARRLGAAPPLLPVPRLLFSGGFSLLPIFHAFDPPYHASSKARSCKPKPQTGAGAAGHSMRCKQGASAMTLCEFVFD